MIPDLLVFALIFLVMPIGLGMLFAPFIEHRESVKRP